MDYEEIVKHRKKKPSSTSKSKAKADHKHEYKDVLFIENGHQRPHKGTMCKLCGKIGNVHFFESEKVEHGYRVLDSDEVFEKFKELEQIQIDSIWQSYVPISKEV